MIYKIFWSFGVLVLGKTLKNTRIVTILKKQSIITLYICFFCITNFSNSAATEKQEIYQLRLRMLAFF
jgi:hypothetical protein